MSPLRGSSVPREHLDVLYISTETAVALAAVLGNVLVVLVVSYSRALRDTTFCFIASLALADIAVGALVIPLAVVVSLGLQTHFYTCLTLSCLLLALTQSSILSLLAIAVDRYLRVRIPTRYNLVVTHPRAWLAVCVCWLLSALTGAVPLLGWHNQPPPRNLSSGAIACTFTAVMSMDYMVYFNFFGWVVAPLVIMVALYAEIFRIIRRQLSKRAEATSDTGKYFNKELKLAKSLGLVVLLFALCWLPLHIMNCILYFCPKCHVPKGVMYLGIFLSHVNSAVNPLVYAFRIERFRTTLVQICHRCAPFGIRASPPPLAEKSAANLQGAMLG
ncbi:adenosine receptor A1-like [Paramormyrops kingsleyae]|uniref:Adenosine receptor A1 n=1 Tax=Paramormyrops kingsleyae TaxID=1676925 RepID=A0A3B3QRV0_9TELE|nr:adenosine receptor A1-like [Paramormyrops kingsleyae]